MKKVLFTATVDSHITCFHIPYLKYFKEQGYIVHVATNGKEDIPYCDMHFTIPFRRSPFKKDNLKAIRQLKKIVEKEQYDLIHTHTPMGSVVTRLASKNTKTRVIYTAHGLHFYKGAPLKNWLLYYPVEKILSRITDTIITINKEDYNFASKKFHCNVKYVKGVGIDPQKFSIKLTNKEKNDLRKSLNIKKTDFVMIYPAELSVNKNQLFLIDLMEKLVKKYPDIHLLLPGKNTWNYDYEIILKNKNLLNNVHLLGYRSDINKLLQISNLSISSSKREGLPVNIMEAMISNLPVVAYNCRGVSDLIKTNVNGFTINKFDINKFINKILVIYNKKFDYQQLVNYNKEHINQYYIDNVLDKVKKIYNKKQRILHVLSSNDYSGAENVAITLIKNFNEFDCAYCSKNGPISKTLNDNDIKYYGVNKLNHKYLKNVIKEFKPNIIHAHDYRASYEASKFSKKCKIISQIHCNPEFAKTWNYKTIMYSNSISKFNNIIFVSNSILKEAIYNKKVKNYKIIYNYVDKNKVIELGNKSYKKNYDIFFIGRLVKEKNPIEFINIVKNINAAKCVMVGNGPLYKKCKKIIEKEKLNIDLLGYKHNPYQVIKNSKIGIMPSTNEGFGLTIIESMILNKPIINSGVGGLSEIFKNNKEFICSNYLDKVKLLLNDTKLYNKYCSKLNNIVSPYCDLDKWKEDYIDVYNN